VKEHPGYFWPCLWLFLIFITIPGFERFNRIEAALVRIAVALETRR
jgi:hypothetical protein